jgi:hypothetical protein
MIEHPLAPAMRRLSIRPERKIVFMSGSSKYLLLAAVLRGPRRRVTRESAE